ncbi:unnamed protein product [Calypogeia fissa]
MPDSDRQPSASPSATNILTITAGIIFFGGVLFILGLRLYALHRRRQEAEFLGDRNSSREPAAGNNNRRTYLRSLAVLMFGTPDQLLRRHDLTSRQDEKLGFGLDASVFQNLPTFTFKQGSEFKLDSKEDLECSVCLEEFVEGEKVRILPKCGHCFHADCVDMWFFSHTTCPICRSEVESPLPDLLSSMSSDTGPTDSSSTNENGPHNRFHSSGSFGASASFTSGKVSSNEHYLDLELGQNGRGPPPRSETAGRQSQQAGSSSVNPSITGPSNSAETIEDGRDIYQV